MFLPFPYDNSLCRIVFSPLTKYFAMCTKTCNMVKWNGGKKETDCILLVQTQILWSTWHALNSFCVLIQWVNVIADISSHQDLNTRWLSRLGKFWLTVIRKNWIDSLQKRRLRIGLQVFIFRSRLKSQTFLWDFWAHEAVLKMVIDKTVTSNKVI